MWPIHLAAVEAGSRRAIDRHGQPGAEQLGFAEDRVVEREPHDLLFGNGRANTWGKVWRSTRALLLPSLMPMIAVRRCLRIEAQGALAGHSSP